MGRRHRHGGWNPVHPSHAKGVVIPVRGILDLDTEYGGITWTAFGTDKAEHYGAYDEYVGGGGGNDKASLDGGTDTCVSVEVPVDCEIVQ